MDTKLTVTDHSFQTAFKKYGQAEVVEFFASWCPHCKQMENSMNALAKEYGGRVAVLAVDVETAPRTAQQFKVQGVPSFIFVKNGEILHRMAGVFSEEELRKRFNELLK